MVAKTAFVFGFTVFFGNHRSEVEIGGRVEATLFDGKLEQQYAHVVIFGNLHAGIPQKAVGQGASNGAETEV